MQINQWMVLCAVAMITTACALPSQQLPTQGHLSTQALPLPAINTSKADIPPPVTAPALELPMPEPRAKPATYSVVVNDVPVNELLFALSRDAQVNVDIHPSVTGRVTLNAIGQSLPQILSRIAKQVDMRYTIEEGLVTVLPDSPYLVSYPIDYVNMERKASSSATISTSISTVGSGTGGNPNASATQISSSTEHQFWKTLQANLRAIMMTTGRSKQSAEVKQAQVQEQKSVYQAQLALATAVAQNSKMPNSNQEGLLNRALTAPVSDADIQAEGAVIVNPEAGIVTVNATAAQHEKIQLYLQQVMSSARRQVLIEATIVEVDLNNSYQAGVDWTQLADSGRWSFGQSLLGGALGTAPFASLVYRSSPNSSNPLSATLKFLQQFGNTRVLSSPKMVALNNQPAILKVVDEKVYFTTQIEVTKATQTNAEERNYTSVINTVPVGMVMSILPQVAANGQVTLNVRPTISRITDYVVDPVSRLVNATIDNKIPQIQVRELESTLQLASGQLAILGGLIQDTVKNDRDQIPGLGDVPVAGEIFSRRDVQRSKTELVIFLRPVVTPDAAVSGDLSGYQQYLPKALEESR